MYTKAVGLRKNGSSCWQGYLPTYWPCCGGSMCYPFYVRTATAAAGKMHLCNNYLPLFAASHSGCISPPFVCTQFSHFLQFGAFLLGLQQQQQKLRWVAPRNKFNLFWKFSMCAKGVPASVRRFPSFGLRAEGFSGFPSCRTGCQKMWQQLIKSVGKLHSTFPEVSDAKVSAEVEQGSREVCTWKMITLAFLANRTLQLIEVEQGKYIPTLLPVWLNRIKACTIIQKVSKITLNCNPWQKYPKI